MSEQPTNNPKAKVYFGELIKKHFNYPMVLLAIVTIFNIKNILGSFIGIFSTLFVNPFSVFSAILTFILSATPVVLLILLWLQRFQKIKKVNFLMGVFLIFVILATIYISYPMILYFFSNISQYDAYTLYAESPFLSVLKTILSLVTYTILAVIILTNKKTPTAYYVFIVLSVIATLFFGILTQMIISLGYMNGSGGLVQAFLSVLSYIALWYIPKTLNDSASTEITKSKGKGIIAIVAIVLFIYIVSSAIVGGGGASSNVSKNTCGYCGRSYSAGDSNGNYMNISKTGLCKNCNNNRKSFEWILD